MVALPWPWTIECCKDHDPIRLPGDLLHGHPNIDLVALFSPEHSITGRAEAGVRVASGRDTRTGLPIHSLYGATQKPTAEMLNGVDALVDSLGLRVTHFDRLAGTDRVRLEVLGGATLEAIMAPWSAQLAAFREHRQPYPLGPENH